MWNNGIFLQVSQADAATSAWVPSSNSSKFGRSTATLKLTKKKEKLLGILQFMKLQSLFRRALSCILQQPNFYHPATEDFIFSDKTIGPVHNFSYT
jgi:hypothetical protein